MRIESVEVRVVKVPADPPYRAGRHRVTDFWHILARVRTADGVEGVGYVVFIQPTLVKAIAAATRELADVMVGRHVLEPEAVWQAVTKQGWFGPGLLYCAIAPLDIALWDAAGHSLGQPLHRLLGGCRAHVPAYASDGLWPNLSADELAQAAQAHRARGFTALKLRVGQESDPREDARRVAAVRAAVGENMRILTDATQSWNADEALRAAPLLQAAGASWLEDPVHHRDLDALERVARRADIPVAAGEYLSGTDEFLRLLERRAVGVLILDLAHVGGITPWRHISAMAHGFGVPVCGHVLPEIHVHLLAAIPNGHLVEYVPRSAALLQDMPALEDGLLLAPERPGLGLALDEAAVRRWTVE